MSKRQSRYVLRSNTPNYADSANESGRETRSTYFDALNGTDSKLSHIYVSNFLGTLFIRIQVGKYNL